MRVRIDSDRCQGHGQCNMICPQLFVFDEQGFSQVAAEEVPSELEDRAQRASLSCPEEAISISR